MKIREKLISAFLVVVLLVLSIEFANFTIQKRLSNQFKKTVENELLGTIAIAGLKASMYHAMFYADNYLNSGNEENKKGIEQEIKEIEKYKVLHEVYHIYHKSSLLGLINKKVTNFVNLLVQITLISPQRLSTKKIQSLEQKLHKSLSELSHIIEPMVEEHFFNAFKMEKEIKREILESHKILWEIGSGILSLILLWGIGISYYISKPLVKLTKAVERIGKGNLDMEVEVSSEDEIGQLARAFNAMVRNLKKITVSRNTFAKEVKERINTEQKLKASLREKEVLLKEIHHRVKNNMQVISSLFNLQTRYLKDENAIQVLKECQNRIRSMALIHESLYRSPNLIDIRFSEYVKQLANNLYASYKVNPERVKLFLDVEDIPLDIETAIPCGLIINELISNALKHAFPENKEGQIRVSMHLNPKGEVELQISDTGVGLPDGFSLENTESLGLKLVKLLSEQIRGKLEITKNQGTGFKIKFKKEHKEP